MVYRMLSFCFVTSILCSAVFAVMDDPDTGKTVPPVVSFRTGTLEAVMRQIYTQSYPTPLIRSHWHIQNIAAGEEKSRLILEREIGFTLALRLEEWAAAIHQMVSIEYIEVAGNFFRMHQEAINGCSYQIETVMY